MINRNDEYAKYWQLITFIYGSARRNKFIFSPDEFMLGISEFYLMRFFRSIYLQYDTFHGIICAQVTVSSKPSFLITNSDFENEAKISFEELFEILSDYQRLSRFNGDYKYYIYLTINVGEFRKTFYSAVSEANDMFLGGNDSYFIRNVLNRKKQLTLLADYICSMSEEIELSNFTLNSNRFIDYCEKRTTFTESRVCFMQLIFVLFYHELISISSFDLVKEKDYQEVSQIFTINFNKTIKYTSIHQSITEIMNPKKSLKMPDDSFWDDELCFKCGNKKIMFRSVNSKCYKYFKRLTDSYGTILLSKDVYKELEYESEEQIQNAVKRDIDRKIELSKLDDRIVIKPQKDGDNSGYTLYISDRESFPSKIPDQN